jgi:hypothetical protein
LACGMVDPCVRGWAANAIQRFARIIASEFAPQCPLISSIVAIERIDGSVTRLEIY